jgi:hypothetical protein
LEGDAFVDAFQLVARVNAAISLVAVVVSVLFIGRWHRRGNAPAAPPTDESPAAG